MEATHWYEQIVMPALLRHARTAYGATMRRALADAGCDDIPPNGMYLLGALNFSGDTAPLGEMIRDLRISKQSAGVLVDTLVDRGYITRNADPDDRRRVTVSLTDRGRAAARLQAEGREAVDAEVLAAVGPEALSHTRRTLAALCEIGRRQDESDEQQPG